MPLASRRCALPPHRFVIHNLGRGDVRYFYAEPRHCVCGFIGTREAYQTYRAILASEYRHRMNISADYKMQVSALLEGDPVDMVGNCLYAAEYFRTIIRPVQSARSAYTTMQCESAAPICESQIGRMDQIP